MTLKQGHAEPLPSDTCPEQRRVQIICFVRDTGVGIAPEFLGQLFQPFRQVDASTTRRHGGTGLGLCICRQLVEMMRGEIWVESEPNVGSTFAFSIPLCTQPDSGATAQLPPPPAQPIHALVLSASPLQTEILCRHFSALGIDALTATNTEEAVRKAQDLQKQPDLLFSTASSQSPTRCMPCARCARPSGAPSPPSSWTSTRASRSFPYPTGTPPSTTGRSPSCPS